MELFLRRHSLDTQDNPDGGGAGDPGRQDLPAGPLHSRGLWLKSLLGRGCADNIGVSAVYMKNGFKQYVSPLG